MKFINCNYGSESVKDISLDLYRIFFEIGKTQNLTRAAEHLYVTQPNVSVALKSLETQLGVTLCARTKKGITLTKEGETLFTELETAFSHIALGEFKVERLVRLDSGQLSLSASDTICHYFLLPYITSMTKQYPGVRFDITNRTSPETLDLVKKGSVDFGFVNLPLDDDAISSTPCLEIHDVLIGGTDYRKLTEIKPTLSEVSAYPLVMLERKSNSRKLQDSFFEKKGLELNPMLELGSLDLIISFVRNNMGLAFIPFELCGHFIDGDLIFRIPLEEELPVRALGIIERKDVVCSAAGRVFKTLVREKPGGCKA
jgi:DNA-binding transcriptional LysR family regulator